MAGTAHYGVGDFVSEYGRHEALMPVVLILSVLASAIYLGVIGQIDPLIYADVVPSLTENNALLLFLATLAATALTSETREWDDYHDVEKGFVIFVGVGLLLLEYSAWFQSLTSGWGEAFIASMFGLVTLATLVVAR